MKNKLLLLTFGILLISLTSALDIYSGDTINITLDKPYVYYSIVGNSSEVLLDIEQIGNVVFITFDKYMKGDSFEIVFFDIEKEIITVYQSGGSGGGTNTIIKYINKTIEVPTYLTEWKTNETIKIVENKTTQEKIVEINKTPLWNWIVFGLLGIILIIIALNLYEKNNILKLKESKELEGGQEENE